MFHLLSHKMLCGKLQTIFEVGFFFPRKACRNLFEIVVLRKITTLSAPFMHTIAQRMLCIICSYYFLDIISRKFNNLNISIRSGLE